MEVQGAAPGAAIPGHGEIIGMGARAHAGADETLSLVERIREHVPAELRELRVWLLWGSRDERKVPYYADGTPRRGTLDTTEDRSRLVTFEAAATAYPMVRHICGFGVGLGAVPGTDIILSGIDLDHCYCDGVLDGRALELMGAAASYTERSPSGEGLHIVGYGKIGTAKVVGCEIYSGARYLTVTGRRENQAGLADLTEAGALARRLYGVASRFADRGSEATGSAPADAILPGRRNEYLSRKAYRMRRQGGTVAQIETGLSGLNQALCVPPLDEAEVHAIAAGKGRIAAEERPEPIPLVRPVPPPAPYPLDALGPLLGPAARAIAEIVQVPAALAGGCVLSVAALAAQAHADVQTLGGERPLSLYVLTIAESGARKSAADEVALAPAREHERRMTFAYRTALAEHEQAVEAAKFARDAARRKARKAGESRDEYAAALAEIAEEPAPRKPWLICSDPTAEGLMRSLADGQYAQGIYTDEGGQLIGGHSMREETELYTVATLSKAWQGARLDRVRSTEREHIVLYGRRICMHLLCQPDVAARMLSRSLYRSQGYLARWLIAAPESLAGTRLHDPAQPAPADDARIRRYWHAVTELLSRPPVEDREVGGLSPPVLGLSPEARALLVAAYDEIEREQRESGALDSVRDWAAKAAEHACRIAGVLTLIADPAAVHISAESMIGALALTEHYLGEYMRMVGAAAIPEHIREAQCLLDWLRRKRHERITARQVMQFGPGSIRSGEAVRRALATLAEHHWLASDDGRAYTVHPAALAEDGP